MAGAQPRWGPEASRAVVLPGARPLQRSLPFRTQVNFGVKRAPGTRSISNLQFPISNFQKNSSWELELGIGYWRFQAACFSGLLKVRPYGNGQSPGLWHGGTKPGRTTRDRAFV